MWLAEGYPMASAYMGFLPFPALESKGVSLFPNHFMAMLGYPSGSPMGASCGEGVTSIFFNHFM
jgi:NO-binding membrane sensor protein with MHYT domain